MESAADLKEYLMEMLDKDNKEHTKFIDNLLEEWQLSHYPHKTRSTVDDVMDKVWMKFSS